MASLFAQQSQKCCRGPIEDHWLVGELIDTRNITFETKQGEKSLRIPRENDPDLGQGIQRSSFGRFLRLVDRYLGAHATAIE